MDTTGFFSDPRYFEEQLDLIASTIDAGQFVQIKDQPLKRVHFQKKPLRRAEKRATNKRARASTRRNRGK